MTDADLVRLDELDDAWRTRGAGARLDAIRRAGTKLRERIGAKGPARCVRTYDIATFPYPTRFGLAGSARSRLPYVFMKNRGHLVQVVSGGRTISILVNPTDTERSRKAPYFARLEEKYGPTASKLVGKIHGDLAGALASWHVAPEAIDYVTFDHLHVQDVRGLLAQLPNAKLLAQQAELDTFAALHPLQRPWYIPDCLTGVPADRIVALDGDYAIGAGFAIVRTPGHTMGNHSIVVVTDRGLWTISENGICVDAYAPGMSRIRGLARTARDAGTEVVLNSNTREGTLDQYTSMVLEKTLADAVPEHPEFPQHFSSSELVDHLLAPGLSPTYSHGAITYGEIASTAAKAA